jgi:hypothetical protein
MLAVANEYSVADNGRVKSWVKILQKRSEDFLDVERVI